MKLKPREKKMLFVLAGVVMVAAVLFFFTNGRSRGEAGVAADVPAVAPTASPSPSAAPAAKEEGKKKKNKKSNAQVELVFSGRDPFEPLSLTGSTSSGTSTSDANPTVAPAGPPPPGPGGGSSTTIGGHSVVLVDVFREDGADRAQVEVDGTVHTVDVGDTFAEDFQLEAIVGTCADFLFGDQPFTLCETAEK